MRITNVPRLAGLSAPVYAPAGADIGWLAQETASYRWLAPRETTVTGPGGV